MTAVVEHFHFLRPLWLLGLLPAALLVAWLWRRLRSGQGWSGIIAAELLPHLLSGRGIAQSGSPLLALCLAWIAATVALAGPSWEKLPQPVQRKEDALVIVYDMSLSMLAEDITPSRLVRSRQKLLDLLSRKTEGTVALVAYAGDAHVVSPLTDDSRTIANLLPALEPGIMPVPGSRPALATEQAVGLLRDSGLDRGHILLVTDGIRGDDLVRIQVTLAGSSYRLSVLGVGTEDGSPIPTGQGFFRDRQGNIVIPALDRQPLRELASLHGGTYSDIVLDESDVERILQTDLWGELESEQLLGRSVDTWHDTGFWLLLLLVPLTLASFRRGWILCLFLVPFPEPAQAIEWQDLWFNRDQQGARLLERGEAGAAAQRFDNRDWAAAAHYRAGEYEQAEQRYSEGDGADEWYNRGNSLARAGNLPGAIEAYEEALQRQPGMEDAEFNKQLLEQLMQQQEQQQQEQQQNEQDQQNQDQQAGEQDQRDQDQDQEQQEQDPQQSQSQDQEQREQEQQQAQQQNEEEQSEQAERAQRQASPERDPEEQERDLANEQWLRRIPDDPSGLLRNKFRYESRQRATERRETDEVW
jgi:Ca-activated chloride channel family protein